MIDILLKNGDISIENGDVNIVNGKHYIVQTILKELLIPIGSDPLFPERGVNYKIGEILESREDIVKLEVEKIIQKYIDTQNNNDIIIKDYKVYVSTNDFGRTFYIKITLIDYMNNILNFSYNI